MDYAVLNDELVSDPLSRGYAVLTDQEVADDLNTAYRTRTLTHLTGAEVYEATDSSEFQVLGDAQKGYVRDIWGLGGEIDVRPGSKARSVFLSIFGGGSDTIAALVAVLDEAISRAEELGLPVVTAAAVARARVYPAD